LAFLDRRRPAFVDIGGEVDKMHAAVGLLAGFDPHYRQRDVTAKRFAQELFDREVTEEVAAYAVQRDYGLTVYCAINKKRVGAVFAWSSEGDMPISLILLRPSLIAAKSAIATRDRKIVVGRFVGSPERKT
jgi:hypothetical protein